MGNLIIKILILQYIIISIFYIFNKEWAKATYWIGIIVVTLGVLFMK